MAACAALIAAAVPAWGQTYPSRAVRLVVVFTAGGSNDILARMIAPKLAEAWGQPVMVENRPGSGTVIGTEFVARSAPDGHTLLMTPPSFVIDPSLIANLPYDALRDFEPVALLAMNPQVLLVNPMVPAKSVEELVTLAKSRKGKLRFSSAGSGGANHLAAELFSSMAGVRMVHVPYRGNAPALTALTTGEVDLGFNSLIASLPPIRDGQLRALGISSRERNAALPRLPTLDEAGLKGYEAVSWVGLSAPARTPREVVAGINAAVVKILQAPELQKRLRADGSEPVGSTPEQFAAFLREESVKWAKVVKFAGMKIEPR